MNEDHVNTMRDYCKFKGVMNISEDPTMLAIDKDGFDMLVNGKTLRISFKCECTTPQQVREALVELANEARETLD